MPVSAVFLDCLQSVIKLLGRGSSVQNSIHKRLQRDHIIHCQEQCWVVDLEIHFREALPLGSDSFHGSNKLISITRRGRDDFREFVLGVISHISHNKGLQLYVCIITSALSNIRLHTEIVHHKSRKTLVVECG